MNSPVDFCTSIGRICAFRGEMCADTFKATEVTLPKKSFPTRETSKLFHVLVLSSLSLGCGRTHSATLGSDAGPESDTQRADDAQETVDAPEVSLDSSGVDPRYCEPGWPTTKGGPREVCVDEEGLIRLSSDTPCASRRLCDFGVFVAEGEPVHPSCCLLPPGEP